MHDVPMGASGSGASALANALRQQLAVILELEDDVRRQFDAERLHDFRVAIRRTRSTVRVAKRLLPADARALTSEWRWLASETSSARDLDVLLEALETARSSLPAKYKVGLDELAERVAQERVRVQQGVHRALLGDRYGALKDRWQTTIDDVATASAHDPDARQVARELIARATRQAARQAKTIDRKSPPEAVHDLRKRTKRLRYTLELFGNELPNKTVKPAVRSARRLQEGLGRFQDDDVHRKLLATLLDESPGLSDDAVRAGRALIARYDKRLQRSRRALDGEVSAFRKAIAHGPYRRMSRRPRVA